MIDYSKIISELLEQKRSKNPSYSIRALARDIGVSASGLVEILHGKKNMNPKIAYKLARHMKLDEKTMLSFIVQTIT